VKTLLLVDLQNDFLPGGALAVPEGEQVVPVANRLMPHFDLVVATKDWHPADHGSFASQHPGRQVGDVVQLDGLEQILWPDHCIQGSAGADFSPDLRQDRIRAVFYKGTDPRIDSYSGLYDNAHRRSTGLAEYLRDQGVDELYIMGLATDYCVTFTVLDAVASSFRVSVVTDGCRAVNLKPGDDEQALQSMRTAGAVLVTSDEVLD
jgi:nicotinamidase/pyrazinamidase